MQVTGKLFFFLVSMLGSWVTINCMQSPAEPRQKYTLHITRRDGTYRSVELPVRNQEQYYQHGISLIHSFIDKRKSGDGLKKHIRRCSLEDQLAIIKAAEFKGLSQIFDIACRVYAKTLSHVDIMQSLFTNSQMAQDVLDLSHRISRVLVKRLNEQFPINSFCYASPQCALRLYNFSLLMHERQDTFIMPAAFSDDVIIVNRDFNRKIGPDEKNPAVPLIVRSSRAKSCQHINQEFRADSQSSNDLLFDGRAFKLSPDGSYMVGFTGRKHAIDTLVIFKRTHDNEYKPVRRITLDYGICTHCHRIDKKQYLKDAPLTTFLYNIERSFAIHPYEQTVAYIDDSHNLSLIDLITGHISEISTDGDVLAVTWAPHGDAIIWSTADNEVFLGKIDSGLIEKTWQVDDPVCKIQWSSDGTKILWMSKIAVQLVCSTTHKVIGQYGYAHDIVQAVLSDDATRILVAAADGTVSLWDVETETVLKSNKLEKTAIISVQLSPDSRYAGITCETDGRVELYIWHIEQNIFVKYTEKNETSFSLLAAQLKSGWPSVNTISLPHMICLVATKIAERNREIFPVNKDHYLAAQLSLMSPHLKKILEQKIVIQ